jgi:hypothetical protein
MWGEFGGTNLLTAGDFDLSRGVERSPLALLLFVTFRVAELVIVICCWGRRRPRRGEQGAEADVGWSWRWAWRNWAAGMGRTSRSL